MKTQIKLILTAGLIAAPLAMGQAQTAPVTPPAAPVQAATAAPATDTLVDPALISRADALTLVVKSVEACEARGQHAAAYVTDADGHQRASLSSDGMNPIGLRSAGRKTATVMFFKQTTHSLRDKAAADPAFAAQYGKDDRYYFSPGGMPLYREGKFVAVLAVGGGRTIDEDCALEALKSVPWAKTAPN